jgi:hypothetical protein
MFLYIFNSANAFYDTVILFPLKKNDILYSTDIEIADLYVRLYAFS